MKTINHIQASIIYPTIISTITDQVIDHPNQVIEVSEQIGNTYLFVKLLSTIETIPARFRGNFYSPPDPDRIEYSITIEEAIIHDEDGQTIALLDKHLLISAIEKEINQ